MPRIAAEVVALPKSSALCQLHGTKAGEWDAQSSAENFERLAGRPLEGFFRAPACTALAFKEAFYGESGCLILAPVLASPILNGLLCPYARTLVLRDGRRSPC